jgi:hypothetical protein
MCTAAASRTLAMALVAMMALLVTMLVQMTTRRALGTFGRR